MVRSSLRKSFRAPWLWILDPWDTFDHPRETSLRLVEEAHQIGVSQFICSVRSIRLLEGQVWVDAREVLQVDPERESSSFHLGDLKPLPLKHFRIVHYRTDPPVDLSFIHPLQIMAVGLQGVRTTEVINPIEVLLTQNEKMEAALLPGLMPASCVSSQWSVLESFGKHHGRTVLKPLNTAFSQGIQMLQWKTGDDVRQSRDILQSVTLDFRTPVLLQHYLEGIANGETRLWFLKGKLLAWIKKLPLRGDFRVDVDRGSGFEVTPLSKKDRARADRICTRLKQLNITLAAVDLIDGFVTDFNFTSPGLIVQMEQLLGENLAKPIVGAIAGL